MKELLGNVGRGLETLPRPVHWWMWWFNLLFLIGVIFAIWHVPARWAVFAHLLCFPVGFAAYHFTRDIALMGAPHIIFWTPLLIYFPLVTFNDPSFVLLSPFGIWIIALSVTIAVSVMFDLRAVLSYLSQHRGINQKKRTGQ